MITMRLRVLSGLAIVLMGGAAFLGARKAEEQKTACDRPQTSTPRELIPRYYGAEKTCAGAGCHTTAPKWITPVCRCDEYDTWKKLDKHARAYEALTWDRSSEMAKHLWKENQDATKHQECLSCHGVILSEAELKDRKNTYQSNEGVSCVICHGAFQNWVDPHSSRIQNEEWRKKKPHEKQELGMNDLWTASERAGLCASCHIGNVDRDEKKSRFVTHDMYAAGHPPLPSFEAAEFSDQMPRHWKYQREKSKKIQEIQRYNGVDLERTKLVLVNAAIALRQNMCILARNAARCAADEEHGTLDFANFDCYACHHDLKSPSWRQLRDNSGKPGRVPMRPWPRALVWLAIQHAADNQTEAARLNREFSEHWKQLQAAFTDRPFGDCPKIEKAAASLDKWADNLAHTLSEKPCSLEAVEKLLLRIPLHYQKETPDYDSARQVAWAFRILHAEAVEELNKRARNKEKELSSEDRKLHEKLTRSQSEIAEAIRSLNDSLKLDLPAGGAKSISDELKSGLERLNNYDPEVFRKNMEKLAEIFGER